MTGREKEFFAKFQEIAKTDPVAHSAYSQFSMGYSTLGEMYLQILLIFYEQKQRYLALLERCQEKYAIPMEEEIETINSI